MGRTSKKNKNVQLQEAHTHFAMQLSGGQIVKVTCNRVLDYPHDGIVSRSYNKEYTARDASDVLNSVHVIHFCRGDPQPLFDDGSGKAPLDELRVRETSLSWFVAQGRDPRIGSGPPSPFSPDEVVKRARACLGAADYKARKRNCQSFATHCYYGVDHSAAVVRAGYLIAGAVMVGAVVVAGAVVASVTQLASTPWV
jgi:hypothetical protein